MKKELKPIAFLNGDGGVARGAQMVREIIFKSFPTVDVPMSVAARLETNDDCITSAVAALRKCGAGFKNSTASNDPLIKAKGWKSANIAMRPLANAFAMLRFLQGPGRYQNPCGVLRFASGGFYEELSADVQSGNEKNLIITQRMNLTKLEEFARLAYKIAQEKGLHLVLASKSTIAKSELTFRETIENVWRELGLTEITAKDLWSDDTWHHELTDIALASLPIQNGDGESVYAKGGFLMVCDNPNGDTASDIVDIQHGNRVMGSTVYCMSDEGWFTYEELPGGTADGKTVGPLYGDKFLNPAGIIFAMCSAFEQVNPEQKDFFGFVRAATLDYLNDTDSAERDTERMIQYVAERSEYLIEV